MAINNMSGEAVHQSEKRSKFGHDLIKNEIMNPSQRAHNRPPFNWGAREGYVERKHEIHVHCNALIQTAHLVVTDLCFTLKHPDAVDLDQLQISVGDDRYYGLLMNGQQSVDRAVLIDSVQFAKNRKGMGDDIWPSIIRLQPINLCLNTWIEVPNLARPCPTLIGGGVLENWELRGFRNVSWEKLSQSGKLRNRERVDQMIEASAQIEQTISNDVGEFDRGLANWLNERDMIASLRVEFDGLAIRLSAQPPINFGFHGLQVLMRPLQLGDKTKASHFMADSKKEPTQKTIAPKEEHRVEIPVPTRAEFFRNLKKAAKPSHPRRSGKK